MNASTLKWVDVFKIGERWFWRDELCEEDMGPFDFMLDALKR